MKILDKQLTKQQQLDWHGGVVFDEEFIPREELDLCDLCSDYFPIRKLKWNLKGNKIYCLKCQYPAE